MNLCGKHIENAAKVRVSDGYLIAADAGDPEYPGISVFYKPDGSEADMYEVVLVERPDESKKISVYPCNNIDEDEPSRKISFDTGEMEKALICADDSGTGLSYDC